MSSGSQFCCNCHQTLTPWNTTAVTFDGETYYFCSGKCQSLWLENQDRCCFACREQIFGGNFIQYGDGRVSCRKCFESAVNTPDALQRSLRKVRAFFLRNYHFTPPCNVQPELYDSFVFKTDFELLSGDVHGVYGYQKYAAYTSCRIGVLKGLPVNIFEETLAHELAHDMMQHLWKWSDNELLSEGFAEYIAFQYNLQAGEKERNDLMLDEPCDYNPSFPDPYYDGLLLFLKIAKKGGYAAVEKYVTKNI